MAIAGQFLEIEHHDLRLGVSRHVAVPVAGRDAMAMQLALEQALETRQPAEVPDTPYRISVGSREEDAVYVFGLTAAVGLSEAWIVPGTELYVAAVACQDASAPWAWRAVMRSYLDVMIQWAGEERFNAPGTMPRDYPWICGYPVIDRRALGSMEWISLLDTVRLVGAVLAIRGTRTLEAQAELGIRERPNNDEHIELKDWD